MIMLATINPPAVVAIPHHCPAYRGTVMGPPPMPVPHHTVHTSGTTGPRIAVPGPQWQHASAGHGTPSRYFSDAGGHSAASSIGPGYSAHHVQYGTERERWAKMSYVMPPAETISLEISAVHEGPGRRKAGRGVPFGVCCVPWSRRRRLTGHLEYMRGKKGCRCTH
jgi:hypothetical protein